MSVRSIERDIDARRIEALDFYFSFNRDILYGDPEHNALSRRIEGLAPGGQGSWTNTSNFEMTQLAHATYGDVDLLKAWRKVMTPKDRSKLFYGKVKRRTDKAFENYVNRSSDTRETWAQLQIVFRAVAHDLDHRGHEAHDGTAYIQNLFRSLSIIVSKTLGLDTDPLPATLSGNLTNAMLRDRSSTTILDVFEKLLETIPSSSTYRVQIRQMVRRWEDHLKENTGRGRFYDDFEDVFDELL
jgi:hypothetical protein